MQSERITLSPLQVERLERLEARFPATRFDVVSQDPFSTAVYVEAEDLEACQCVEITPNGRTRVR